MYTHFFHALKKFSCYMYKLFFILSSKVKSPAENHEPALRFRIHLSDFFTCRTRIRKNMVLKKIDGNCTWGAKRTPFCPVLWNQKIAHWHIYQPVQFRRGLQSIVRELHTCFIIWILIARSTYYCIKIFLFFNITLTHYKQHP